jgi:hypothetical protein
MIVGALTTCHTQYAWDKSICIILFDRTRLQVFVTYLIGALYVHLLWFYKHQHDNRVHSKLFVACNNLQFQDTCGKRRNINPILDITPQKEITWGCIWRMRCTVYDKLLKPRRSFWITLYICILLFPCSEVIHEWHFMNGLSVVFYFVFFLDMLTRLGCTPE